MDKVWKKYRSAAIKSAASLPGLRSVVHLGGELKGRSPEFRDIYTRELPSAANPFQIFKGAWSSAVPGFETGSASLFDDPRIKWIESQIGSFSGLRVLELGPLEGGHTCMMERAGARVTAIEANQRAFLKCLIVKNALHLNSEFLYGDFRPFLAAEKTDRFDFVLAIGVLYHMLEPLKLLHDIASVTDAFAVWTHYYDPAIIHDKVRFDVKPRRQIVNGYSAEVYTQHYMSSVAAPTFCGGTEPTSCWLTKAGLLDFVTALGFRFEIGEENPNHPNGPSILFFAKRG